MVTIDSCLLKKNISKEETTSKTPMTKQILLKKLITNYSIYMNSLLEKNPKPNQYSIQHQTHLFQ